MKFCGLRRLQTLQALFFLGGLILLMPVQSRFSTFNDQFYPYLSYEFGFSAPRSVEDVLEFHIVEHKGERLNEPMEFDEFVRSRGQAWKTNHSYRLLQELGWSLVRGMDDEVLRHRETIKKIVLQLHPGESLKYVVTLKKVNPANYLLKREELSGEKLKEIEEVGP